MHLWPMVPGVWVHHQPYDPPASRSRAEGAIDPLALFRYLTQTRHVSEDIAQDVVVDYLEGKLTGARSLEAWAVKRAQWHQARVWRQERGEGKAPRQRVSLQPLQSPEPSPLTRADHRQCIERVVARWGLTPSEAARVLGV